MPSAQKSESPSIAFLATTPANQASHNDNHLRLPQIFSAAGAQVEIHEHKKVSWRTGTVWLDQRPGESFDLIWPLGFGPRQLSLDLFDILQHIPQHKLITKVSAYRDFHAKLPWISAGPQTIMGTQVEHFAAAFHDKSCSKWVLKPNAGSLGRDVYQIESIGELEETLQSHPPSYWLLQPYLSGIRDGEFRTLVCADNVLGTYKRTSNGLTTNLSQGGVAELADLPTDHQDVVTATSAQLTKLGIGFAAIDTVDGKLMEVNLANPGGLGTLAQLLDSDPYQRVCDRLVESISARHHLMF
ncbi:MAG: hypothetical protein AAF541_14040 [Pseudomonadota bacterium]